MTVSKKPKVEAKEKRRTEVEVLNRGAVYTRLFKSAGTEILESKQLLQEVSFLSEHDLVEFPFMPEAILLFYESNSIFFACVNQIAKDIAGRGWTLQKVEGAADDQAELATARAFLDDVYLNSTVRDLVVELGVDWGTIGNFYVEVIRNQAGRVANLFRIPAQTMRVSKDKKTYCQSRNEKHVWFKAFGNPDQISSVTGKVMGPEDKPTDIANEVIHYKSPFPKSDYYGAPNIISAIGDLVGLIGCRDYNLSFFDNFGLPAAIITLTGDWDEGAETKIRNFLKTEIKGAENAHKSLVLSQTEDCKVEIKPLDPNPIKDLSFDKYEKSRKENILIAYSMPPERIGMRVVGQLGGNVAEESTKVYTESVIEPLQLVMEAIFNRLLKDLGIVKYRMKLMALDLRNMAAISDRHVKEIEHGILTPNQALNELGLPPYEGGDQHYIMAQLVPIGQVAATPGVIKPTMKQLEKAFDEHRTNTSKA